MKTLCAWCDKVLANDGADGDVLSHGICDDCMVLIINDDGTSLQSLIEQLDVPVLVVDDAVAVITGNSAAQLALGKSVISIKGYRSGDAIECEEAAKPGGCGRQGKCKVCVIRGSVNRTFRTGDPVAGALAEQTITKDGVPVAMQFRISTVKRDKVVFLFVEDIIPA